MTTESWSYERLSGGRVSPLGLEGPAVANRGCIIQWGRSPARSLYLVRIKRPTIMS
jgi:hypothetical protein